MLRAGRFKHRLLDDVFLQNFSLIAHSCLQGFTSLWSQNLLRDTEMAALYVFVFSFLRRPKDFLGGPHNTPAFPAKSTSAKISSRQALEILLRELPAPWCEAKILQRLQNDEPFLDFFCSLSWRSIPLSAARSLVAWERGDYDLRLCTHVPSPEEVLAMQANGQRCISMLLELEEIQSFVEEGRDVLGFIIHDLIHADHFFAEPEKARAQVDFCRKLIQVQQNPTFHRMLEEDPILRKEFHYLMSDMNSVPLHLLKTLKAVVLGYFKRRDCVPLNAALSANSEKEFLFLYNSLLGAWNFSPEALLAAERLNTPLYKGLDDSKLLHATLCANLSDATQFLC